MLLALSTLVLVPGCSGTDDTDDFVRPEVCDDGVDNNDNGLVDCDDADFCGGLQCVAPDTDEDTDVVLPDLEIVRSLKECCDFQWADGDCPKSIGTFTIINRGAADAIMDTSCDLVGTVPVVHWQVVGGDPPEPFIIDEPLYAGDSATIEGIFKCEAGQRFTTHCRAKVETDEDEVEIEFDITGTPAQ